MKITITSGGTPETAYPTNFPSIGSPNLMATDLLANKTPADPSVT